MSDASHGLKNYSRGPAPTGDTWFDSQHLSAAKARELLGWAPGFDLEAGLRETSAWYGEFLGRTIR